MKHGARAVGAVFVFLLTRLPAAGDAIQQAIDRGLAYLKAQQRANGTWPHEHIGATALAGLALLECGVPADDPAVRKAAEAVRTAGISLTHTYSLALAILFLDRARQTDDVPLLESLAFRLLAGQKTTGGWTYACPGPDEDEVRRLKTTLQQRNELRTQPALPRRSPRREPKDLAPEIQQQLGRLYSVPAPLEIVPCDNSNTQFAILALWVARRHGLPVEVALARVEARFRASQNSDGGWGYVPQLIGSSPAMTCAGLLGLAAAHGLAGEVLLRARDRLPKELKKHKPPPPPGHDPAVRGGLLYLGNHIGLPVNAPAPGVLLPISAPNYYGLWSLERTAVAYGLKTIARKDWYTWGTQVLLASQRPDGSWQGEYAEGGADTCFALLFLSRSDLAGDLTTALKGKVQDPGERELRAGGLGSGALRGRSSPAAAAPPARRMTPPPVAAPTNSSPPPAAVTGARDAEAARLAEQLVHAPEARQAALLEILRQGKGAAYTEALAEVIGRLEGPRKTRARDALAERLARMTARTLRDKLQDANAEVRRAAVLACALKEDRGSIPALIPLLEDPQPLVARAARAALKALAGTDLGPDADAWRARWRTQVGK